MFNRFAEVEATAALSLLIKNYRLEIKPEALIPGETPLQRRERILAIHDVLTLTPNAIPVRFIRR